MTTRKRETTRVLGRRLTVAALALALATVLATSALAGGTTVKLGAASNKTLGKTVVVNPSGRTLYQLSPETSHHLLCKTKECLKFWPPLTVPSRTTKLEEAAGVHGKLGLLHRSNGAFQVTLRGVPLYRFSGDHRSGEANGEGIESFGGVWHAMTAAVTSPPSTTTPSAPTSSEPYGY
jgi:predicted lipoprotein with Yx(FWY)xxD motif